MSIILQIWDDLYVISLQVLTKKQQTSRRANQDSRPPNPWPIPRVRMVTADLNLTCKIFSLKQKIN